MDASGARDFDLDPERTTGCAPRVLGGFGMTARFEMTYTNCLPPYCVPLRTMSFLTDFTPLTPLATLVAFLMSALDATNPVNCTMPL